MNIDKKTFENLKEIFDAHNELTIQDIEAIDIARDSLVKYFSAYRLALVVEKIHDVWNDRELSAQINLMSSLIDETKSGIDKLRLAYLRKKADEEEKSE